MQVGGANSFRSHRSRFSFDPEDRVSQTLPPLRSSPLTVLAFVSTFALSFLSWEGGAQASNYFLDQLTTLLSKAEVKTLRRAGIRTTDELARRGATPMERESLSRLTKIRRQRLAALTSLADLMRLSGIGPDAARVMKAAGCQSIGDLQQADPRFLADAIKKVNDRTRLSTNPPKAENLVVWIERSQSLPLLYEPDQGRGIVN